jgi:hypothetical protein
VKDYQCHNAEDEDLQSIHFWPFLYHGIDAQVITIDLT